MRNLYGEKDNYSRTTGVSQANDKVSIELCSLQQDFQPSARRSRKVHSEPTNVEEASSCSQTSRIIDDEGEGEDSSIVCLTSDKETLLKIETLMEECRKVIDDGQKLLSEVMS